MGGTVSEPGWKQELRSLAEEVDQYGDADYTLARLMPHIEAAYQRGLIAGRSQQGYTTRRKRKEGPCPTSPSATDATESSASAGEP